MPARRVLSIALLVLLGGCAKEPPPLYPLTGTVTQAGKRVTGGGLIFIPESGDWGGMVLDASVNPDGTFAAQTARTGDEKTTLQPGVPAGRYRVVFHPPGDGQKFGNEYELPDRIAVEAKENFAALVLPDLLPSQLPDGKGVRDQNAAEDVKKNHGP